MEFDSKVIEDVCKEVQRRFAVTEGRRSAGRKGRRLAGRKGGG